MSKPLSALALCFFSVAFVFDILSDSYDITGMMNVGFMCLSLAAIVGRDGK